MENKIKIISIKPERDKLREIHETLHGLAFGEFSGIASMKASEAAAYVKGAIDKLEGLE